MSNAISNSLDVLKQQLIDGKGGSVTLHYLAICKITDDFSEERKIGSGAHGDVYWGELWHKRAVAVKKLKDGLLDHDLFKQEAKNLMEIPHHKNVVWFLGYCFFAHQVFEKKTKELCNRIERILCFEYMSNESLDKYITDGLRGLPWQKRFRIIKEICEGVEHLHAKGLVHFDLKPQNILLDENMLPKIADFGISKFTKNVGTTTSSMGTQEYYDPNDPTVNGGGSGHHSLYFYRDIYSVGIIITEVVTGSRKKPESMDDVLKRWKHRWSKSKAKDDTRLWFLQVIRCLQLAEKCRAKWNNRPQIAYILSVLREVDKDDDDELSSFEAEEIKKHISGLKDMLGIRPLELRFPFEHGKDTIKSSTVELTNNTNEYIAFRVSWLDNDEVDVILPGAKRDVPITLKATPDYLNSAYEVAPPPVTVESTRVSVEEHKLFAGDKHELLTMFLDAEWSERQLDEVRLDVFFDKPKAESNQPTAGEPTEEPFTPQQLLQVDPTELRYAPNQKQKKVQVPLCLTNMTDKKVAFMFTTHSQVMKYASSVHGDKGILGPWSKWGLLLSMEPREGTPIIDDLIRDKLVIRSAPLDDNKDKGLETEDINEELFDTRLDAQDIELKVVFVQQDSDVLHLTTTVASRAAGSPTTLMSFDAISMDALFEVSPLELRFPFEPSKPISSIISLTNRTSRDVYFLIFIPKNRGRYDGILEEGWAILEGDGGCSRRVQSHSTIGVALTMIEQTDKPSNMTDEIRIYISNKSLDDFCGTRHPDISCISLMATLCEPYIPKHEDMDIDVRFGKVKAIDVHPTKPLVLTYHQNAYMCLWKTYKQQEGSSTELLYDTKCKYSLCFCTLSVRRRMHPKFIPRTQWILAFHIGSPNIYIYNDKLEETKKFEAHDGRDIKLATVDPTDTYFLTATSGYEIKLWKLDNDTAECHPIRVFEERRLSQLIFDPRGSNTFATVASDRIIKIWSKIDPESPTTTSKFSFRSDNRGPLYYCSTESELKYIVVGCCISEAKIVEIDPQKRDIHTVEDNVAMTRTKAGGVSALIHPTLPFLVRCGDRGISIWNYKTDRLMQVLEPCDFDDTFYVGLMELEGNKRLVVGAKDGVKILDINWVSLSGNDDGVEDDDDY